MDISHPGERDGPPLAPPGLHLRLVRRLRAARRLAARLRAGGGAVPCSSPSPSRRSLGPLSGGVARPPRLLRPHRPARPRVVHPVRAPHDRRRPRRPRQGADRAGARVPPGRDLRRGAAHPAPGHPGRRGQELLLPFRRGLPCAAAGGPEDGGALARRMVEGRPRVAAAPAARRLDAHAAARPRLLPAEPDEPRRRGCALPRRPGPAPAPLRWSWGPPP